MNHDVDNKLDVSKGTIVRVACGKGYGLNLDLNVTAKCVRGRWKPEKPKCEICKLKITKYFYIYYYEYFFTKLKM